MIRYVVGLLGCMRGKHERSADKARRVGADDQFVSQCMYCGVPMRRRAKRDWIVDRSAADM